MVKAWWPQPMRARLSAWQPIREQVWSILRITQWFFNKQSFLLYSENSILYNSSLGQDWEEKF